MKRRRLTSLQMRLKQRNIPTYLQSERSAAIIVVAILPEPPPLHTQLKAQPIKHLLNSATRCFGKSFTRTPHRRLIAHDPHVKLIPTVLNSALAKPSSS